MKRSKFLLALFSPLLAFFAAKPKVSAFCVDFPSIKEGAAIPDVRKSGYKTYLQAYNGKVITEVGYFTKFDAENRWSVQRRARELLQERALEKGFSRRDYIILKARNGFLEAVEYPNGLVHGSLCNIDDSFRASAKSLALLEDTGGRLQVSVRDLVDSLKRVG